MTRQQLNQWLAKMRAQEVGLQRQLLMTQGAIQMIEALIDELNKGAGKKTAPDEE